MKKQFLDNCEGKPISFKELKDSNPSTPTATAQVTSPAPAGSESDSDDIAQAMSHVNTLSQSEEFGFNDNIATCTIDRVVNEETVPKWEVLKETEFVKDKTCLICFKSDMYLNDLSGHLSLYHSIAFEGEENDDPVEEWIYVANQ